MGNKCPKCGAYLVPMLIGRGEMCPKCEFFRCLDVLTIKQIAQKEENK